MKTFIRHIWFTVPLLASLAKCQDFTPENFMRVYIDLRSCDWDQRMCGTESFLKSDIEVVRESHRNKCVKDLDLDGNLRGYEACNPQHRSHSWYKDFCLVKGYIHYNVSCEELLKKRIECQYEEMCPASACRRDSQFQTPALSNNDTSMQPYPETTTAESQLAMDIQKLMKHQVNLYIAIGVLSVAVVGLALPHIIQCFRKKEQTQETTDLEQQGQPEIRRLTSQQPDDASDKAFPMYRLTI